MLLHYLFLQHFQVHIPALLKREQSCELWIFEVNHQPQSRKQDPLKGDFMSTPRIQPLFSKFPFTFPAGLGYREILKLY